MKRVLVTAGTVYGPLDDNKLVGNRVRGIWATRFARWLKYHGHDVTLLVADIQRAAVDDYFERRFDGTPHEEPSAESLAEIPEVDFSKAIRRNGGRMGKINIVTHRGFWDYQELCHGLARTHDAAVMAAAVVNWIPKVPFPGKMPTSGYKSGDVIDIPFILAPHVIDGMRRENPKLTLIGCKMTIGVTPDELIDAAYKTLLAARCNAVVANDMKAGLKVKHVVHQDRTVVHCSVADDAEGGSSSSSSSAFVDRFGGSRNADRFYEHLHQIILDEHFQTTPCSPGWTTEKEDYQRAGALFDRLVEKYRGRFLRRMVPNPNCHGVIPGTFIACGEGGNFCSDDCLSAARVFGAVAVRLDGGALCSPREKGQAFGAADAVDVAPLTQDDIDQRIVNVVSVGRPILKATLNAPLLLRHLDKYPEAAAVLHLHEMLRGCPTVPYAPPGTVRDNLREIPGPVYNIEGHGCIAALDANGEVWKL
jgi:hypothetical protein